MHKAILLIVVALFLLSACGRPVKVVSSKGAPPGQVQKATGYNPASGKVKTK